MRPEIVYFASRPCTVVATCFVVDALNEPFFAGPPNICGMVSMLTVTPFLFSSTTTMPRVKVTGGGLQVAPASSYLTSIKPVTAGACANAADEAARTNTPARTWVRMLGRRQLCRKIQGVCAVRGGSLLMYRVFIDRTSL